MLTFLAAALMQSVAAAPAVDPLAGDPDLRCMAAYLVAVGQMTEDPTATEEDKAAGTAIVMYFFGKVRGRNPDAEIKSEIRRLIEVEGYVETELKPDLERCGEEFGARGKELEAFGSD